ncbi:MAG: respiratory chain complex I subunit 1 family protein [Desulfovibrionaceae bacterium]|nr:NADH-quinone oxidoreductase subunit H [Desulfovibrionaceae bacterium]
MSAFATYCCSLIAALVLAPLLPGIINRVKAKYAGRQGKPVLQLYYDLAKLLRKGAVISETTTWVFAAGPTLSLATTAVALLLLPLGGAASPLAFQGDFLLAAYILGLGRFFLILAALDTGSAFEGMGASREAAYSALAEPVIFLCFLCLAGLGSAEQMPMSLSLSSMFAGAPALAWTGSRPEVFLLPLVIFLLLLVENCRIPIDDPNTHLELTMIHEVMILDHSGPDLAFIHYAAALKLWFFSALLAGILVPSVCADPLAQAGLNILAILAVAVAVGVTESVMARVRLFRISHLLGGAGMLAALSLILTLMR